MKASARAEVQRTSSCYGQPSNLTNQPIQPIDQPNQPINDQPANHQQTTESGLSQSVPTCICAYIDTYRYVVQIFAGDASKCSFCLISTHFVCFVCKTDLTGLEESGW